jgi:hypothetical protein
VLVTSEGAELVEGQLSIGREEEQESQCKHTNTRVDGGGEFFPPSIICKDCGETVG